MSTHTLIRIATPAACLLIPAIAAWADEVSQSSPPSSRAAHIRAAIRAGLPKYQPKLDRDDATLSEEHGEAVERDGVLNLPTVKIRAKKLQRLGERDVITPAARIERALKHAPGDKIGNIFGLNNGHALAILREETQLKEFNALKDRANQISLDDGPENQELERLIKDTTTRQPAYWQSRARP